MMQLGKSDGYVLYDGMEEIHLVTGTLHSHIDLDIAAMAVRMLVE
jgi:hypothetical protein